MEIVPFKSRADQSQPKVIEMLEQLLADAREGKIHRLVVVGVDEMTGVTHFLRHRAIDTAVIGAVSAMLYKLQSEWSGL